MSLDSNFDGRRGLGVLWGKSNAGGTPNLLVQHLLDAAAVAEQMWDHYLAPSMRGRIDACCDGQGRQLLAFLCALHDIGKASPAFQVKDAGLAAKVQSVGLPIGPLNGRDKSWHHTLAGAVIARRLLPSRWGLRAMRWVWPLIGGHHGYVPSGSKIAQVPVAGHGTSVEWLAAQDAVFDFVIEHLGLDVAKLAPGSRPSRADQLTISGLVIMADWIASDGDRFQGIETVEQVSMQEARGRAVAAWEKFGLRGGWRSVPDVPGAALMKARFDKDPRPIQAAAIELAESLPAPGLIIVEAPMGVGKTEIALSLTEIFARRFGTDGLFFGLPTQATSDPMYSRARRWANVVEPNTSVALLHGKRHFNKEWREIQSRMHINGIDDEFNFDGGYGQPDVVCEQTEALAEWFLGRKRGLLSPFVVGTIDQLLHAATRTKHVMLRYAGLAGKVVVLDEVHAYDVYMAQFLFEALRWLGEAGVPVVVLSATLPPARRADLVKAYAQGATGELDIDLSDLPQNAGYPSVLAAYVQDAELRFDVRPQSSAIEPSLPSPVVQIEVVDEPATDTEVDQDVAVDILGDALAEGGCALVIRNTVARAQDTYKALKARFGGQVKLLHSRLTVAERAERTENILRTLGPDPRAIDAARPQRYIVVATQVAEQSFDVDADVLITDLAPIDLLLQRIGRLHRHDRAEHERPVSVRSPKVFVTGLRKAGDKPPWLPAGSKAVYSEYPLLRSADLVFQAEQHGWSIPQDVPRLVAQGYDVENPMLPESWSTAADAALEEWNEQARSRKDNASMFLLAGEDLIGEETLDKLHYRNIGNPPEEQVATSIVRDGKESVEVVLIHHDGTNYRTLNGTSLGINGDAITEPEIVDAVMGSALRLPAHKSITEAAKALVPLPGWRGDPWLRHARALQLDASGSAELGGYKLTYDDELGLHIERLR